MLVVFAKIQRGIIDTADKVAITEILDGLYWLIKDGTFYDLSFIAVNYCKIL